ncbi:MAG: ChbG/HpnK family deacetylase [Candidatus Latescibacteria bacterium]|nr:ChbG/HpnK family deacetylase [Candidatus Latescibacterota bacterium]
MEPTYLLVRADDIGMAQSVNQACIQVYQNGIARSVELMAPCPWFMDAVRLLEENPQYDVGVHLTLTSEWDRFKWGPLTRAPGLVAPDGYFCPTFWGQSIRGPVFKDLPWALEEVEAELRAQIEKTLHYLPQASHLSGHMGLARVDERIGDLYRALETEYNLGVDTSAFARFAGFGPQSQTLSPEEKTQHLRQALEQLQPGHWIFVDHPAYDTTETQALGHDGYDGVAADRHGVTQAWSDAGVLEIVAAKGIELVSYGDIKGGEKAG